MAAPTPRQGILTLTIKDKSALYVAYMPFIKNGGLFIPTSKAYRLGDEVFILLTLMDQAERLPVAGRPHRVGHAAGRTEQACRGDRRPVL